MTEPSFYCRHCGTLRLSSRISVKTVDESAACGLPAGTLKGNYPYCNDVPACMAAAEKFQGYFAKMQPGRQQ